MTIASFPAGSILGYPRIGRRRELKKAVESFWAGKISADELEATARELRRVTRERLVSLGLGKTDSAIPEAFSFYDQMLDAAVTVGAIPTRFTSLIGADGTVDLAGYFTIARGEGNNAPVEMTKWFDSNYHYLVPEIGPETDLHLASDRLIREVAEATTAGFRTRPVIVGPVTFLLLSKPSEGAPEGYQPLDRLDDLLPIYAELFAALTAVGAEWVQLDEPALVSESDEFVRHGVRLTEQLRMRDVVEGHRDHLLSRFRVTQLDGLQSGLTNFNTPCRLSVCHDRESPRIRTNRTVLHQRRKTIQGSRPS